MIKPSSTFLLLAVFFNVAFIFNAQFVMPRNEVLVAACMLGGLICWVGATILQELGR